MEASLGYITWDNLGYILRPCLNTLPEKKNFFDWVWLYMLIILALELKAITGLHRGFQTNLGIWKRLCLQREKKKVIL